MEKVWIKGLVRDEGIRRQPWTTAESDETHRYYNFRTNPELIPEVLEDYKPWSHEPAVQKFYELVRWVNSDESVFESNDCAFHGPKVNSQKDTFHKELVCSGRLMFFIRHIPLNLSDDSRYIASEYKGEKEAPEYRVSPQLDWAAQACLQLLKDIKPEFEWGSVGIELHPAIYDEVSIPFIERFGHQGPRN